MIDISTLCPGDRVRIVDSWVPGCRQNVQGKMDKWLGSVMTVSEIRGDFVWMEEDRGEFSTALTTGRDGRWNWHPAAIAKIVTPEEEPEVPDEEVDRLLSGL